VAKAPTVFFLDSNKVDPIIVDQSCREVERNTYCSFPTILPTPDYWRPDFVPSIAGLKNLSYKDLGSLSLHAIEHSLNSTLRTTFVFQTKPDEKETLTRDPQKFKSPPIGSYY